MVLPLLKIAQSKTFIYIYIRFEDIQFAQTSIFIQNVVRALILEEAQQSR